MDDSERSDSRSTEESDAGRLGARSRFPKFRMAVAGRPISLMAVSAVDYPDFLSWWMDVGRLTPLDSGGWSSISGPGVMRDRVEAIPAEQWDRLPASERDLIRHWAATIRSVIFYD